ncbi:MAG: glyoxylate reductase [Thermoleophilales bacterium]|nr:glyoxylate reductase [Thermoleophilales bacterium]
MSRCFVTRDLPGGALARLRAEHDVEVWPERTAPPHERLLEAAADADGLLTMVEDRVDRALLDAAPSLRAIANCAVGTNNIDLAAAAERGIAVGNTPDVLTETTADLAWALLMAGARRLGEAERFVRAGKWKHWEPGAFLGLDVYGATLGVVGYGRIGQAVARRASGFDMEVLHTRETALDDLLARSDFVSLHTPLKPETRGLIGARELGLMKPHALLVNTGRGELVDTDALVRALHAGEIGGAALDVTDPEPLPGDHPLLSAPGVTVVPHIGSASERTRAAMAEMAVDNLLAALSGESMPYPVASA